MIALNRTYLGRSIPLGWIITSIRDNSASYRHLLSMLIVSESVHESDGQRWLHITVSHPACIPTWQEIKRVKSIWIGDDRVAYHVLPSASTYDDGSFHLWTPLDDDPFPEAMQRGVA